MRSSRHSCAVSPRSRRARSSIGALVEQLGEEREPRRRVVGRRARAARRAGRSARRAAASYDARDRIGDRARAARRCAGRCRRASSVTSRERVDHAIARGGVASASAAGSSSASTSACGYGSSASQSTTRTRPHARRSTSAKRPSGSSAACTTRATVADVEARVAAADLAPALDEHDAELAVAVEHVARHQPVARLEHVQRQAARTGTAPCRAGTSAARSAGAASRQFQRARTARSAARARSRSVRARSGSARCRSHIQPSCDGSVASRPCSRFASMRADDRVRVGRREQRAARTRARCRARARTVGGSLRCRTARRRGTDRTTRRRAPRPSRGSGRACRRRATATPIRRPTSIISDRRARSGCRRRRSITESRNEFSGSP